MPKKAPCPVCKSDVKVPRDAEPGHKLTCPDCDEVFTPQHLKTKAEIPENEETYGIGEHRDDIDEDESRREKKRKAKAIEKAGEEYLRETESTQSHSPPFFGGPEVVLLVVAAAMGLVGFIGSIAAKRYPSFGECVLIVLIYGGLIGLFVWRKFASK